MRQNRRSPGFRFSFRLASLISIQNRNWECLVFVERENWRTWRNTLAARTETNNKLSPYMTLGPGFKTGHTGGRWTLSVLLPEPIFLIGDGNKCGKRDDCVLLKTDKGFLSLQEEACTEPWTALPHFSSLLVSLTNSEKKNTRKLHRLQVSSLQLLLKLEKQLQEPLLHIQ